MTIEQLKELANYERQLYTSKENNYVMFGSLENKRKLSALYAEIFNKKSNMLNGCGSCALREMKELAKLYFTEKSVLEKQPEENKDTEENKPIKRGRKKKEEDNG